MALVPCQVLRVAILLSYCSILCNYKAIEMPSHQTYGGSWKFLTFIDLVIQAVFFGICVLTDLSSLLTRGSGNQEQERQLKKLISLRDWMLAVLAFPVGVFVVAVFWIIYAYDREMIYPKLLDNFIPGWLNHGMHTTVLPFILIEMRTSHHAYPSRSSGLAAICTFSVGYILWQWTTFLKKTVDPFNRTSRWLLISDCHLGQKQPPCGACLQVVVSPFRPSLVNWTPV
ncbi:androgen-induced gene 1 protein isoform X4 [Mirounga angustirostris]|uniref:androgen-induced gene 1 protein isoform X4 n=1 Tax=Mirounga angustirostris TaxID=9716 RepID=UPI001E68E4CF|nr:androgen-induced gene 1 protein isoform X5 [Mirounga angustirostris]